MKPTFKTQQTFPSPLVIIPLIVFAIFFTGCKNNWTDHLTVSATDPTLLHSMPPDPYNQLVVLRKPGTTDQEFTDWINKVEDSGGTVNIPLQCANCDNNLMLLTGPGITNYIQQATASGGSGTKTGGGPSGEDGPVYYSINYGIDFSDSIFSNPWPPNNSPNVVQLAYVKKPQPDVTVAVFDTGIDTAVFNNNYFYTSTDDSCCLGIDANNGYNFSTTPYNKKWLDDFPKRHGSLVSKFIVDQVNAGNGNGIKLLPVKIHDKNGQSNLFSVLCGFSYAANRGAKIINASFGYYTPRPRLASPNQDSCAVLLKEYVKEYLTKKGILLIAAAGNAGPSEQTAEFAGLSMDAKRNLDSVAFYPASLARDTDLPNVIAVTTVNEIDGSVSPVQNFSPNVVDVGVNADNTSAYTFINPIDNQTTVIGSSFATPIVTGKICANYFRFVNAAGLPGLNKQNIFSILSQVGLVHTNSSLVKKINGIRVMNKRD